MNQVHTCVPVNQLIDMALAQVHERPYSLCCYYVLLLVLVKMSNAFDGHIICLRGTGCENDVFWLCTDKICDILLQYSSQYLIPHPARSSPTYFTCFLHSLLSFPPIRMCAAMRIPKLVGIKRKHCIQDSWIHRSRGLYDVRKQSKIL